MEERQPEHTPAPSTAKLEEQEPQAPGPAPDLEAKRAEVQKILIDMFGKIEVTKDSEFTFAYGSTRIFVDVFAVSGGSNVVNVYAIATIDLPPSEELFRFLALNADASLFGHLGAAEREGMIDVVFSHRLLADHLDRQELERTVATVATTANEVDDVIVQRFGGRRYRDVVSGSPTPEAPSGPPETPGYL
jgi:hypothetical protein